MHDTVNHSEEFKSETGYNTNAIEGVWGIIYPVLMHSDCTGGDLAGLLKFISNLINI